MSPKAKSWLIRLTDGSSFQKVIDSASRMSPKSKKMTYLSYG